MGQAVRLRYLEVQGFRSISTRQRIEFDANGLVLLRGESGDGKSSLFLAIAYVLDFCPIPATALQCWLPNSPTLEVEVGLSSSADGDIVAVRGTDRTTLKVGSEKQLKSVKAVKERLQKVLGNLPPDLRSALTYRGQRKPGLFLSMTNSEKKDFLTQVLDLGKYENQISISEKKVSLQHGMYEALTSKVKALIEVLGPEPEKLEESHFSKLDALKEKFVTCDTVVFSLRSGLITYKALRQEAVDKGEAAARSARAEYDAQVTVLKKQADYVKQTGYGAFSPDHSETDKLTALQTSCCTRIKLLVEEDSRKKTSIDNERAKLQLEVSQLKKKLWSKDGLEKKLAEKDTQLLRLRAGECPTCLRPWLAEQEIKRLEAERVMIYEELGEIVAASAMLPHLEQQVEGLVFVPDPMIVQLNDIKSELDKQLAIQAQKDASALKEHCAQVDKEVSAIISQAQELSAKAYEVYHSTLKESESEVRRISTLITQMEQELQASITLAQEATTNHSLLNTSYKLIEQAHNKWVQQAAQVDTARNEELSSLTTLNAERDYLTALKGFLGGIFAEILDEVSDEANKLLAGFPNTADCTIRFATDKTNQDGTTSQTITSLLSMSGHEADVRYHASGGQLTSVELAVDMAVRRIVSRRTGTYLGWTILDESFNGHTKSIKESCLEILQRQANDDLVIVVDHASEFQEMFTKFVDVKRINGATTVS